VGSFKNYFYFVIRKKAFILKRKKSGQRIEKNFTFNQSLNFITSNKKSMKRIKILFSAAILLMGSVVYGQKEVNISAIKAGSTLSDGDVGFLTMVSNATVDISRGSASREATVAGTTYKAGQTLTAADAKKINKAIKAFQKTYKAPEASRAGWCYYWYYYCDGWGYCYWYKYWYICY
jgi:hypothetical protein